MGKPPSLGRGLGSLIRPKTSEADKVSSADEQQDIPVRVASEDGDGLRHIPVDAVSPNPRQPRVSFDEQALEELAGSLQEHGMLQPVVVSEPSAGRYEIIMGERRWRAAQRAGFTTIPAIIRAAQDQEKLELALVENIVREDLNPVELAHAYRRYIDEFGLTHDAAAARLGKSRSVISNTIRLLQLPEEIQQALKAGEITDAHAKVIVGLPTRAQQLACFQQVVTHKLSVARTRVTAEKLGGTKEARVITDARDEELQRKLRQHLGARVTIARSGYRGKVIVEFFNYDELVDIVNKILGED